MLKRVISAVFIVLFTILMLWFSNSPVLYFIVALASVLCLWEALFATKYIESRTITTISLIVAASVPFLTALPAAKYIFLIFIVYGFTLFITMVINFGKLHFEHICVVFMLSIVIPFFFSTITMMKPIENGNWYIAFIFVVAYCTDTLALFSGMFFGKHKLSPRLSPKKTVEGAVGGIAGGVVGAVIFGSILDKLMDKDINFALLILTAVCASVAGQLGDLSFSLIKRSFNIKDFGKILPGHGGFLDRLDSVLFIAPLIYVATLFVPFIGQA